MKRAILVLATILLAAPLFADKLTFNVIGIDCEGCAKPILDALRGVGGVTNPTLDWKKGIATVDVPASFDREKIRTALTDLGFDTVFAGETHKDTEQISAEVLKTLDVETDMKGKRVDEKRVGVPNKITIVDYYAEWCGPCKVLESRLLHYMTTHPNVALRRVNVGKWNTPAAEQLTRTFYVGGIPYLRIYDANGKFKAAVKGAGRWDNVLAAIEKAQ